MSDRIRSTFSFYSFFLSRQDYCVAVHGEYISNVTQLLGLVFNVSSNVSAQPNVDKTESLKTGTV